MKKLLYAFKTVFVLTLIMLFSSGLKAQDPEIQLIQPTDAGIEILIGMEYLISWTDNLTKPVEIQLSTDGGSTYSTIDGADSVVGSTWLWDTDGLSESTECKIRVRSTIVSTIKAESENEFSLLNFIGDEIRVIQPSSTGIDWVRGTEHLISWTDNLTEPVIIQLWKGTEKEYNIASNVTGSTYAWTIPSDQEAGTDYWIRIKSTENPGITDRGDNDFEISEYGDGSILVLQPNGIESWGRGEPHLISWTDNLTEPVIIQLWNDDGKVYNIASNVEGSTYLWNIPADEEIDDDYYVRIKSSVNAGISDVSDSTFDITAANNGFIQVIQPNGEEEWLRGTSKLISWTDNLPGTVKVDLYKGGVFDTEIADSATGSTLTWDIPVDEEYGEDYSIKITSNEDGAIVDDSDEEFTILETMPGAITVLQPDVEGIQWTRGTQHLISWTDNLAEPVIIQLWKDGVKQYNIAGSVTGSTYTWSIPDDQEAGDDYKIRVKSTANGAIADFGDNDFEITTVPPGSDMEVIQPNGGENWIAGSTHLISWIDDLQEPVIIQLWKNGVKQYNIASGVEGSTYEWTIPAGQTIDDDYKIRVKGSVHTSVSDYSDDPFSISLSQGGNITVNQPNGGEIWYLDNTYWIYWDDDVLENVDIDLVKYDVDTVEQEVVEIANDVPGTGHEWLIDSDDFDAWDYYKVRIYSTIDNNIVDESNGFFKVMQQVMARVYPNPVNGTLTLNVKDHQSTNYNVIMYNRFNSIVYRNSFNSGRTSELSFSTANLSEGIYFLTITSDKSTITKKVVVQH